MDCGVVRQSKAINRLARAKGALIDISLDLSGCVVELIGKIEVSLVADYKSYNPYV